MKRPCLDCGILTPRTRCPRCTSAMERKRPTSTQRGYGRQHKAARRALRVTLPVYCAYGCGAWLTPSSDWVAAHRVDGDPSAGWIASCRTCNERAKVRMPCAAERLSTVAEIRNKKTTFNPRIEISERLRRLLRD